MARLAKATQSWHSTMQQTLDQKESIASLVPLHSHLREPLIFVYIRTYIHTYIHLYIYIYIYVCVCVQLYVCMCGCQYIPAGFDDTSSAGSSSLQRSKLQKTWLTVVPGQSGCLQVNRTLSCKSSERSY